MDGEIGTVEPRHRQPIVILVVIVIILVGAVIWIGNWAINRPVAPAPTGGLTEAERAEIMKALQSPAGTLPLTEAERAEIMKALQSPSGAPPLTEAEERAVLDTLRQ